MKYLEYRFDITPANSDMQDVLSAVLGEVGFESFVPTEDGENPLFAYVQPKNLDKEMLRAAIENFPVPGATIDFTYTEAEDKDWNKVWEENYFKPLVLGSDCVVSGTMHTDVPKAKYNIIINPKMSFGTGHHATTAQMLQEILKADINGLRVLDMGCGTGILGILAAMRGASSVVGVDFDEWCVENTKENLEINGIKNMSVVFGDASALENQGVFDIILANINRNILMADMPAYIAHLNRGGRLFMSGFYEEDVPILTEKAETLGLRHVSTHSQDRWACIGFEY